MKREVVRLLKETVNTLDLLHSVGGEDLGGHVWIVSDDLQSKARRPLCHTLGDAAEPEQAEGPSLQARDRPRISEGPGAVAHAFAERDDLSGQRQEQRHGVVGHLVQTVVGDVRHHDAPLGGRVHVDRVDADPGAHDHLALFESANDLSGALCVHVEYRVAVFAFSDERRDLGIGSQDQVSIDQRQLAPFDVLVREDAVGHHHLEACHVPTLHVSLQ